MTTAAAFVLYVVLYAGPNNARAIVVTGEHTSQKTCEDAVTKIRNTNTATALLAVCTPK